VSSRGPASRGLAPTLAALLALSCHGEQEQARRADAGRLVRAVQLLRDAPNDGKRPLLSALEHLPAQDGELGALQTACVSAYSLEVEGIEALSAIRRATRGADEPVPPEAALLLSRSEEALHRAAGLTRRCADLEGEARRRYKL
jgi:hypothetical protein